MPPDERLPSGAYDELRVVKLQLPLDLLLRLHEQSLLRSQSLSRTVQQALDGYLGPMPARQRAAE